MVPAGGRKWQDDARRQRNRRKTAAQPTAPAESLTPGVQGDREDPFAFITRLKQEEKALRLLLQAVRGGRFRGRKPNGEWWVTIAPTKDELGNLTRGREARDIRAGTPVELVQAAAVARCFACGCDTDQHAKREPTAEEATSKRFKDAKRCAGEKLRNGEPFSCGCTRTPEDIQKKQGSPEWMAERLAKRLRDSEPESARAVSAATVFAGLRGPAKETQEQEGA